MTLKKDKEVNAYISNSTEFARPILRKLRRIIRKASPNLDETMKWNHPFYGLKELSLSFSKAHENVRLTFFNSAGINDINHILKEKKGSSKSMFFRKASDVDEKTVTSYIKMAIEKENKEKKS